MAPPSCYSMLRYNLALEVFAGCSRRFMLVRLCVLGVFLDRRSLVRWCCQRSGGWRPMVFRDTELTVLCVVCRC